MLMHKLGIKYEYTNDEWIGEYKFHNTNIWDSARRLEAGMFKQGMMQCLSFGWDKPLSIGRGGAILLDDLTTYKDLIKMRYDGRDLSISPWHSQRIFKVGYHYKPLIEEAEKGLKLLDILKLDKPRPKYVQYPDLRTITIID
jgi:hypothetical protein